MLYQNLNRYDEAELLLKQAITIYRTVLGIEHFNGAQSLGNLALLYHKQGKYKEAEPLYQQALVICEKVLGMSHPETVRIRRNYTRCYTNPLNMGQ